MTVQQIPVIAVWTAAAALLAAYVASIAGEITYVTLADGRKTERKIPLLFRMLLPFVSNLSGFVGKPVFGPARAAADVMIVSAGMEGLLSGSEFVALKFLVPLVCGTLWTVVVAASGTLAGEPALTGGRVLLVAAGWLFFYAYPLLWLRRALSMRHLSIMRSLPFVLDLLTLSVEAGMDFMSAMQRNCERSRIDPLNEELIRMTREIQMGIPRRTALKSMADRVRQPDLKAVAFALIQADELGVPIAPMLRIQSDQMRARRFDRAERLAAEAPVKMLGPLLLCIFPAVVMVLLAPVVMQAAKSF